MRCLMRNMSGVIADITVDLMISLTSRETAEGNHPHLLFPVRREIAKSGPTHTTRKSAFGCGFDDDGTEKRKTERHSDLTIAAAGTFCDCLCIGDLSGHELG